MASGPVTVTTADVDIDQAWSTELNDAIKLDIVLAGLFEDKSGVLPHGDTFHLPASHNMTANTKAAGVDAIIVSGVVPNNDGRIIPFDSPTGQYQRGPPAKAFILG
jgi:hypothetical protein